MKNYFIIPHKAYMMLWMACVAEIGPLKPEDTMLIYGALGNFSLSGFELVLTRYVSTYIITYYLPSGARIAVLYVDRIWFLFWNIIAPGRLKKKWRRSLNIFFSLYVFYCGAS